MTDQKTRVAVGLGDSLPDVLNRLRKSSGTSVSLDIPAASSLFLTASEFRALQATADRDHISVSVTTDDPLRQQLATLFNLPVEQPTSDPEPIAAGTEPPPPEESPVAEPPPVESQSPTSPPEGDTETNRSASVSSQPVPDPDAEAATGNPGRLSRATARARATTTRQRLVALGAVVAVLTIAYLAAFLFLTRATVVLTLKRQPISQDLSIGITAPGAAQPAADLSVAAAPVSFAVSTTQTTNATGTKTVGDAPAGGRIILSNPTGKSVTVEAGTQLEDKITGTKYAIAATVDVVAGKDGTPGYGEAQVTCLEPGTAGNREIGFLSGRLPNGIYYANREDPIAGGTDKQIPIVTQTDLDTLQARATEDLRAQAAQQSPVPEQVVLASTIQLTQPSFTFDHRADEEAATVTIRAGAQASALAYSPSELRTRVADALAATVPAGYEFDRASLQVSEPTSTETGTQAVLLTVHADGSALAVLTLENRAEIASTIAGDDESAAKTYLATLPGVESSTFRYSPGWLPHRIPSSAKRIEIETT
jgi:hypothetical protein